MLQLKEAAAGCLGSHDVLFTIYVPYKDEKRNNSHFSTLTLTLQSQYLAAAPNSCMFIDHCIVKLPDARVCIKLQIATPG